MDIETIYSDRDQARIDSAYLELDEYTGLAMRKAKDSGCNGREAQRMVEDDPSRRLMIKSITAMISVMVPVFLVRNNTQA